MNDSFTREKLVLRSRAVYREISTSRSGKKHLVALNDNTLSPINQPTTSSSSTMVNNEGEDLSSTEEMVNGNGSSSQVSDTNVVSTAASFSGGITTTASYNPATTGTSLSMVSSMGTAITTGLQTTWVNTTTPITSNITVTSSGVPNPYPLLGGNQITSTGVRIYSLFHPSISGYTGNSPFLSNLIANTTTRSPIMSTMPAPT